MKPMRTQQLENAIAVAARVKAESAIKHWFAVDGELYDLREEGRIRGAAAYAPSLNQPGLEMLCRRIDVQRLGLKILHASDLGPLSLLPHLEGLSICYAPKLVDASPLARLESLKVLRIEACKNLRNYGPLTASDLRAIEIAGGMWKANDIDSVEPFAEMPALEELSLDAITVEKGGLRPLASSRSLRQLAMPYEMPLEEYAVMKALRPDLIGADFQPFREIAPVDGKDLLLIARHKGRRRWFSARDDAAKIAAITEEFDTLVQAERGAAGI